MILDKVANEMSGTTSPEKVPSNGTYEIIMVSVAGGILLASAIIIAVTFIRKRWKVCCFSYDKYMEDLEVPNISLSRNAHDNISTLDFTGPVHISYISEKEKPVSEIPISKLKLSRDALLYISLITCINVPDIDSGESL
ncbi:hypothetical protein FKM82_031121 [Ascaphus truei]